MMKLVAGMQRLVLQRRSQHMLQLQRFAIKLPKPTSYKTYPNDPNVYGEQAYAVYHQKIDENTKGPHKSMYWAPIKKKQHEKIQKVEFEIYQEEIRSNVIKKISDERKVDEKRDAKLEQDELWGSRPVPTRYYEKITGKERYWLSRADNYHENLWETIHFLKEFSTRPYLIFQQEIR